MVAGSSSLLLSLSDSESLDAAYALRAWRAPMGDGLATLAGTGASSFFSSGAVHLKKQEYLRKEI